MLKRKKERKPNKALHLTTILLRPLALLHSGRCNDPLVFGQPTPHFFKPQRAICTLGPGCEAEIHWYEAHGIGRKEFKIKRVIR